ncbi:MAG: MFS transporter [Bacteroidota bacterium]
MINRLLKLYIDSFRGLPRDIWILSFIMLVNRAGTMVILFLTVYLTQELDFSFEEAGLTMSFFGVGSVAGTYLGGQLTDRFGYHKVQITALFLTGILFLVLLQMTTFWAFSITIFILTLVSDTFRPACLAAIAAYSTDENRTRSFSLIRMAINLGFSAGPAVGGAIAIWKGYGTLFWIDGMTCMAAAVLYLLLLKEKQDEHKQELVPDEQVVEAPSPYRDTYFLLFSVMVMIAALAFMQLFSSYPVYLRQEMGYTEDTIGMLLSLNGFLIVLVEMPLIYVLERRDGQFFWISMGAILFGLSFFVLNISTLSIMVPMLMIVLITFGEIFLMPLTNAVAASRSVPQNRGQYMALYGISYSIAHIFAPAFGMAIAAQFGFATLWVLCLVLGCVSAIGFWRLRRQLEHSAHLSS